MQDCDRRAGPEDAAEFDPLLEMGYKELSASGSCQNGRNLFRTQAISIRLDDSSADGRLRVFLKKLVVLRDGSQIDREDRAGAADSRRRWVGPGEFLSCRAQKLHVSHLRDDSTVTQLSPNILLKSRSDRVSSASLPDKFDRIDFSFIAKDSCEKC
jgi:hypothetical protein